MNDCMNYELNGWNGMERTLELDDLTVRIG